MLTDLMFIDRGRIVLECSMEEFEARYLEVMVHPEQRRRGAGARRRSTSARCSAAASCCSTAPTASSSPRWARCARPSIADLFVAVMGAPGAAA